MPLLGIIVAAVVDVVLPVVLAVLLIRANFTHRESARSERGFWIGMTVYAVVAGFWVVVAIVHTFQFNGAMTFVAIFVTLPLSALPSVVNSTVIHYFFTDAEWLKFGYFVVLTLFLAGLLAWASLAPLAIRRMAQLEASRRSRMSVRWTDA